MTILWSASQHGFFDTAIHHSLLIPDDAREVTRQQRDDLIAAQSSGAEIISDPQGMPVIRENASVDLSVLLHGVKTELRAKRMPLLDALTGIAGRSQRAGNTALATEADALAVALLDITDDPALNAAQTLEDMQAAGVAAYRAIASTASAELAVVFKEITGT
ncbi:hypothetical protein [Comamonas jiangduensis]|uniref:hypothetical protein n=1 Tax=Comamonas jiangduensis TaxID=1194168 RepID=UPI001581B6E5|nr:hypothetical protein [Comamonas jiangduensis]